MLSRCAARQVEIWPTMLGTLLLAMARRVVLGTRGGFAASGVVDAVADIRLEEIAQLIGHHDGAVLLGLAGRGAEVRQGDHAGMA